MLAAEYGGVGKLAEVLERSQSQTSQWLNASLNSGTGKRRGMRPGTSRYIEEKCGKPNGWMDADHSGEAKEQLSPTSAEERRLQSTDRREVVEATKVKNGDIEIPQFQGVGGSMGGGVILRDQPGEIQGWRVTPEWIQKNVKNHTGANNLAIVTGFGDSMRGMFNPGDPLLVDRGVTAVEFDSIYFFRIGGEGFIKRLQRVPGEGLIAISENKAYRDWTIKPDMDFEVFARVIKVWCGTDF